MSLRQDGPGANDDVLTSAGKFTRDWFYWLKNDRWKETSAQSITNGALTEIAHKLDTSPNEVFGYLKCTTAEHGYSIDDRVSLTAFEDAGTDYGISLSWNETNIGFTVGASGVRIFNKSTGAMATLTNANWRVILRCRP